MRIPRPVQLTLTVLALLAGAVFLARSINEAAPANTDAPQGTLWLCGGTECGREFTLSTKDLAAFYDRHPDGVPPCPACGKAQTARAIRCTGCAKAFVPPARSLDAKAGKARACPHCGKPVG